MSITVESTTHEETPAETTEPVGGEVKSEVDKSAPELASAKKETTVPGTEDEANEGDTELEANGEEPGAEGDEEDEEDEEVADEVKPKPKRKGGFQRKIDRLHSRLSDKDREIESLRSQLPERKSEPGDEAPVPKVEEAAATPKQDDFEEFEDYLEALVDFKAEAKLKERDAKDEASRSRTIREKSEDTFKQRASDFAEVTEDYDEVIKSCFEQINPPSPTVDSLLIASENGPALIYELAKDPEYFEKLNGMTPLAAAMELGRFESKLNPTEPKPVEEKVRKTKAPKPVTPVGSKGSHSHKSSYDAEGMSQKEYEATRDKEEQRRRRA